MAARFSLSRAAAASLSLARFSADIVGPTLGAILPAAGEPSARDDGGVRPPEAPSVLADRSAPALREAPLSFRAVGRTQPSPAAEDFGAPVPDRPPRTPAPPRRPSARFSLSAAAASAALAPARAAAKSRARFSADRRIRAIVAASRSFSSLARFSALRWIRAAASA
jgi:hypothetical protein